jgi:hypothetical protein
VSTDAFSVVDFSHTAIIPEGLRLCLRSGLDRGNSGFRPAGNVSKHKACLLHNYFDKEYIAKGDPVPIKGLPFA